jgi:hypothetical protein
MAWCAAVQSNLRLLPGAYVTNASPVQGTCKQQIECIVLCAAVLLPLWVHSCMLVPGLITPAEPSIHSYVTKHAATMLLRACAYLWAMLTTAAAADGVTAAGC